MALSFFLVFFKFLFIYFVVCVYVMCVCERESADRDQKYLSETVPGVIEPPDVGAGN